MRGSGLFRNGIVWVLVLVAIGALVFNFMPSNTTETIDLTNLAKEIKAGKIEKISVRGDELRVKRHDSEADVVAHKERDVSVFSVLDNLGVTQEVLDEKNVEVLVADPSRWGDLLGLATTILPLLFFGGLIFFMMRQAQTGGSQALSFGKSKARLFSGDKPTVTFEDVAGVEEAKQELSEVVEFLREPE
ncbi:MAG: ATP-dependent metallopeptidase FtsH/Yme1/Tma family protein, partial [Anaerolineae bacterium]